MPQVRAIFDPRLLTMPPLALSCIISAFLGKGACMRRVLWWSSLVLALVLPAAAGPKDKGTTKLKDLRPVGVTDKKNKHQQFEFTFASATRQYECRTKPGEKVNAAEWMVGGDISYEVNGDKIKLKSESGKKEDCKIVRVSAPDADKDAAKDAPRQ